MMDINNNDFFGDIKHDELDNENVSASGIRYGENTNNVSSPAKTIFIAVGVGAIVAGALILALNQNKKPSQTNLAEIPTISSPVDSIKTEPQEQKINQVYENATVYAPENFDNEAKKLINAEVVKPTPIPSDIGVAQRVEPVQNTEVKKAPVVQPTTKQTSVKTTTKPATTVKEKAPSPVSLKTKTVAKAKTVETKPATTKEVVVSKPVAKTAEKPVAGQWNVQLTSTSSETAAKKEWINLSTKYSSILKGLNHTVSRAEVAGKTYYRLRITGLESSAVATEICNKLKAQNYQSCYATK